MHETLDILPGENVTEMVIKIRRRRECEECGNPAHYKHTFLMFNPRSNPASQAYRHDDCSYCEDACRYVCKEHKELRKPPEGYDWCATFSATERFSHMFLYWFELKQNKGWEMTEKLPKLDWISLVIRDLCELPDRSSPDDDPEAIIATADEIRAAIECNLPPFSAASPDGISDAKIIELAHEAEISVFEDDVFGFDGSLEELIKFAHLITREVGK